jgi:polysaccharide export outer membrane protein
VVVVSEREPRSIYVMGLVKEPGEYDLPYDRDVRVLDALALAKGRTTQLADKVLIIRQLPGQSAPSTFVTSVRKAKNSSAWNRRLAPGDIVSVEETPTTFVLEMLKNFVRFGVSGSVPLF